MKMEFDKKPFVKTKGFTLIELMIVIVIIGVVLGFAIPSYISYVQRSNRTEGITTMQALQLAEEKFRMTNSTYQTLSSVSFVPSFWPSTGITSGVLTTENSLYTIVITGTSATGYTITATAQGDQVNDDAGGTACTPMTLVVSGYTITKSPTACW